MSDADVVGLILDRLKCFGSSYQLFSLITEKGSNVQGRSGARPFGKYAKLGGLLTMRGQVTPGSCVS
jgi:hypothetical protein